ncbi:unnamed protein product [Mytilus edulis]|uniref:Integrase zinc-binding domain-containing protein n=1 Tax=Mytilus edulis TaxID=6550 RepID=A0A8S3VAE1_MYTED|nr:unnamed protein product [Mytilus edulis]
MIGSEDIWLNPKTRVGTLQNATVVHESPIDESIEINFSNSQIKVEVSVSKTQVQEHETVISEKKLTLKDIDIASVALIHGQSEKLQSIIDKYSDVFCQDESDLGYTDLIKHKIVTVDNKPIAVPHRRIPPHQMEEVGEHIKKMVKQNIIRKNPEIGECKQLLVPETMKTYVLDTMHNSSGHQGIERTYALIQKRCYWLNMLQDIKLWIQKCERCLLAKNPLPQIQTSMGSLTATKPLQIVAIDFTLLEKSSDGRENVLIITDIFSKFTQAIPTIYRKYKRQHYDNF